MRVSAAILLALLLTPLAARAEVRGIRFSETPERTRIVLDLSARHAYEVSTRRDPERLVIDLPGVGYTCSTSPRKVDSETVHRLRCNRLRRGAQVVLDLKGAYVYEVFTLDPVSGRGLPRLVIDVLPVKRAGGGAGPLPFDRDVVVVIDPGHGGADPGAVRGRLREKTIVLDISRRLRDQLEARGGYKVVLTRDSDLRLTLAERRRRAEDSGGDLFLSIHCNSAPSSRARGVELFYLSLRGASNRKAQVLADKENRADLVGGVMNGASHQDVKMVLDHRMKTLLRRSYLLAQEAHRTARKSPDLRSRGVKRANFAVCKNVNMPSVLVEVGFLSNARDRELLGSDRGCERVARWLTDSVDAYLRKNADFLDDPLFSEREKLVYQVRRGDNLSRIAGRFGVSLEELVEINRLAQKDHLEPGQKLLVLGGDGKGVAAPLREHRVRRGENLSLIAQRHGVSVRQLMKWNGLKNPNRIRPGQTLRLGEPESERLVHKVCRGENLSLIAARYGTSVRELVRGNGLKNPDDIRPGQELIIIRKAKRG